MSAALLVRLPPGYEPERRYVTDVVLREFLGVEYRIEIEDRRDVEIDVAEQVGTVDDVANAWLVTIEPAPRSATTIVITAPRRTTSV